MRVENEHKDGIRKHRKEKKKQNESEKKKKCEFDQVEVTMRE